MAKCDLSIELDDAEGVHIGGEKISGMVRVNADSDVNCTALEVTSVWRTHGRGNVASGEAGKIKLFEGQWRSGEQQEYRFELPIANWPPTYYGFHLNVEHSIDARAKVPWSFDPKASVTFKMRPGRGTDVTRISDAVTVQGPAAKVIGLIVMFVFTIVGFVIVANFGAFGYLFLLFPVVTATYWFIKSVLPAWALGEVHCRLTSETFVPGENVTGELIVRPRKRVAINGASVNLLANEQCVSGSGSNRTTHKHNLFDKLLLLSESTTLTAGQEHRFAISVPLVDHAYYSIDLKDNKLMWHARVRIDIPRWPDWVKDLPLRVVPSGDPATWKTPEINLPVSIDIASADFASADAGITFAETAKHLWSVRDDRGQVEILVEAVSGLSFNIEAQVERRLLYAGDEDPHVYKDGFAVWVRYPDPPLPMVLYVPHGLGDDFEQLGNAVWRGRGTVVGWDGVHGRLQVKL